MKHSETYLKTGGNVYKILFLGNFTGRAWDGSVTDENHIADALETLGHKVYRIQREAWKIMDIPEVDFTLIAKWQSYGDISSLPKPILYWCFDYMHEEDWHLSLIKSATLYLGKEISKKAYYEQLGTPFHWLPQDFTPESMDKFPDKVKKKYDVVFTGSYIPHAEWRNELLKKIDKKFDLHIFSANTQDWSIKDFKNVHPAILDDNYPELIAQTKINISCDWVIDTGYWSDRMAQIMACEGFVLNKYIPMQEVIYKDYPVYFKTIDECMEKIGYYLDHEEERTRIAKKGYQFATHNLKVSNRVKDLLTIYENRP